MACFKAIPLSDELTDLSPVSAAGPIRSHFRPLFDLSKVGPLLLSLTVVMVCTTAVHAAEFRLPDDRRKLDAATLNECGLQIVESRRLILVTDLPLDAVRDLPPLADALFDELERQMGQLVPNMAGTDFQVTGFLIDAKERFEKANVLPPEQFAFRHGRHLGYQFWMNNQTSAYYRRHLLLHEFVHCFMMCEHGMQNIPPLWFTEGIAEYFATHQLEKVISQSRFGILPPTVDGFEGWGRIAEIRDGSSATLRNNARSMSLEEVLHPATRSFADESNYAHAWAIVWLMRNHPNLKEPFADFNRVRTDQDFRTASDKIPAFTWKRLAVIWPVFLDSVVEGFDVNRSFPTLGPEPKPWPKSSGSPSVTQLASDQDWQSSGFVFSRGSTITLKCTGRYAVHDKPQPWISEPDGITIEYYLQHPTGRIMAMIVSPDGQFVTSRIRVGSETTITIPQEYDGELWLQINDSAAKRAGNSGSTEVRIEAAK